MMCSSCSSTRWVSSLVLSIGLMWSCGSKNQTKFTLRVCCTGGDLGGLDLSVSTLLLKSLGINLCLWFFWRSCSIDAFFLTKMVLWKGMFPNFQHAALITISLYCCYYHMQENFILGREVIFTLIFGRINWVVRYSLDCYRLFESDLG